jgi:hypothetical protein
VHEWTGSGELLCSLAQAYQLQPWSGSPLLGTEPALAPPLISLPEGFGGVLHRVTRPELRLDLTHVPPAGAARVSCFGVSGSDWLACHWQEDDRHHLAWPATRSWLARPLLASVDGPSESTSPGTRLTCDRAGYETIAGVADLLQHESLAAQLDGRPIREPVFAATDLLAAFLHPRAAHDLRWMSARARRVAPVPLVPSPASLEAGLAELARAGWTRSTGGSWRLEPPLRTAAESFGHTSAWFAVSRRVRERTGDGGIAWRRAHAAVLRARDRLWIFDFAQLSATDFRVDLGDAPLVSVRALVDRLLAPLAPTRPAEEPVRPAPQPPRPAPPPAAEPTCAACGARARRGVKFCTSCGARL